MSTDSRTEPLFTHRVQGDKRSFFFNVKRAQSGELYLTLSQFAKVGEEWVRLKLVVGAEDAKPFYQGLCEAIRALRKAETDPVDAANDTAAPPQDNARRSPSRSKQPAKAV